MAPPARLSIPRHIFPENLLIFFPRQPQHTSRNSRGGAKLTCVACGVRAHRVMLRVAIATLCCATGAALQLPAADSSSAATAASSALSRRALIVGGAAAAILAPSAALAFKIEEGASPSPAAALDDIPPKAKQAFLQYLPQLQLDGDFYLFTLFGYLAEPGRWDRIRCVPRSPQMSPHLPTSPHIHARPCPAASTCLH